MPKRAARTTKNAFQQMLGCFKKSDHMTKIKYKEHLIVKRKKEFGVAYINLVQKSASEQVSVTFRFEQKVLNSLLF